MNFYYQRLSGWLKYAMILFSIAATSCGVQNKLTASNTITGDEQPFYWRVEIKVQPYNNDIYYVLAALGKIPQTGSSNSVNDLPGRSEPGTIVVYITATNTQIQQLRESLLEACTIAIFVNKVNHN
jgi:hypothetical protein